MSFLLMNLFTPTTARAVAAGNTGNAGKPDAQAGSNASGDGAAFSAMLASAKDRIGVLKAAPTETLKPQMLDAATAQAIKQPADILAALKDMTLSEQQLTELRATLRDALDTESFAGDEQTEQAFQELHDQLEVDHGDGAADVVDIEAVVLQLPAVTHASAQPRSELLTRIAQFIQATVSGQGTKADTAKPAQITQAPTRTDPLLEVVQASMFPDAAAAAAPAQAASQSHAEALIAAADADDSSDDLPQWVRDIAPANPAQPKAADDAGDIYRGMALPEVTLPGSQTQGNDSADDDQASNAAPATPIAAAVAAPVMSPMQGAANTQEAQAAKAAASVSAVAETGATPVVETPELPEHKQQAAEADATAADAAEPAQARGEAVHANAVKPAKHAQGQPELVVKNDGQSAQRETLAPLPEKAAGDVSLELVRQDAASTAQAPTHQDKLAATAAHRVTNASLYQHRAEVVEQVHVAITRASKAEMDRITIQLDPADLGRVDVMMELRRDGTTQLVVAAERRETLDMLQRDARSLERALQEAGVKADAGSMEFNLRQQHGQTAAFGGHEQGSGQPQHGSAQAQAPRTGGSDSAHTVPEAQIISSATYTVNGGLNVIV